MLKKILFLGLLFITAKPSFSQNGAAAPLHVQPQIMVMPFTKEGEDVRTVLDNNPKLRIAIGKVKESFSKRNFKTKDFLTTLKDAKDANIFTSDNQTDVKAQLVLFSGAEVFVEADLTAFSENGLTSVTMPLNANESSTGYTLSSKVAESGQYRTSDTGLLASKAVEQVADEFLAMMQTEFDKIIENGKSVKVNIGLAQNSKYNFDSEIGSTGLPLSDLIRDWMKKNSYKGYSKLQGTTKTGMIFSDVHIPFKDATTGVDYDPADFALQFFSYLKSLGLGVSKQTKLANIYITIK